MYNSTGMDVIDSCVLYHHVHSKPTQALNFNITNIKGSVPLSCTDTFAFGLVLGSDKLDKKLPSGVKMVISQA